MTGAGKGRPCPLFRISSIHYVPCVGLPFRVQPLGLLLYCDDNLPAGVFFGEVADGLRGIGECVGTVDRRSDLAGFDEMAQLFQNLGA
jgi:hypothetical protein